MKKFWWPPWAYESRPWAALSLGALAGVIALVVAIYQGSWSGRITFVFGVGAAFAIYGGILLQLRREYRETSKWARRPEPPQKKNE